MVRKSTFVYVGVRVTDLQRSIEFYTKVLGMKVEQRFRTPSKGECVHLRDEAGGFLLELNHYDKDSPYHTEYIVGEGLDHLAFAVEKFDDALDEARRFGHPPILELKIPTFRWAYIEDPDGIWIELLERWPE